MSVERDTKILRRDGWKGDGVLGRIGAIEDSPPVAKVLPIVAGLEVFFGCGDTRQSCAWNRPGSLVTYGDGANRLRLRELILNPGRLSGSGNRHIGGLLQVAVGQQRRSSVRRWR